MSANVTVLATQRRGKTDPKHYSGFSVAERDGTRTSISLFSRITQVTKG